MFICGKCKAQNDDQRKVCYECGNGLDKETSMFIPGKPTTESEAGLSAPPISTPQGPQKLKKLKQAVRIPWGSMVSLLILIASGVAVYLAMQKPSWHKIQIATASTTKPQSSGTPSGISAPGPNGAWDNPGTKNSTPPPVNPNPESVKLLLASLKDASKSKGGSWSAREVDINELLATMVKLQSVTNALGVDIRFVSSSARLGNGSLDALMSIEVANYPVSLSLTLKPVIENGNLRAQYTSASIGRLYFPGFLAGFVARYFEPIGESLESPLELIAKAKSIEITPQKFVVRWP